MKQYIEKVNEKTGEITLILNPEWKKKIQNEKYHYFLNLSGIPKDYHDLDIGIFKWDKSLDSIEKCRKYIDKFGEERFSKISLYLLGSNSSGKTTVACSIGKELIRKGYTVRFILAGHLANLLLQSSNFDPDEEVLEQLKELKKSDFIILDDAFDPNKSVMWNNQNKNIIISLWDQFLRDCLSKGLRFAITSNISISELGSIYGKSFSELLDRNFYILKFEDEVKIRKEKIKKAFD